ncbi:MAG: hypothetical protein QM538_06835 [Methylacidiphilales bacterium]|nr:hypothetical protein [Candidatus Methylacidiphilales bacterium]
MASNINTDVAILGAGFASLIYAISTRMNKKITIYESKKILSYDSLDRQLVLSATSVSLLRSWGLTLQYAIKLSLVTIKIPGFYRTIRFSNHDSVCGDIGYSVSATSFLHELHELCRKKNLSIIDACPVSAIAYENKQFKLQSPHGEIQTDSLIMTGGDLALITSLGVKSRDLGHWYIATGKYNSNSLVSDQTMLLLGKQVSIALVPCGNGMVQLVAVSFFPINNDLIFEVISDYVIKPVTMPNHFPINCFLVTSPPKYPAILIGNALATLPPVGASGLNATIRDCHWLLEHGRDIDTYMQQRLQERKPLISLISLLITHSTVGQIVKKLGTVMLANSFLMRKYLVSLYG